MARTKCIRMEKMTWDEIQAYLKTNNLIIIPTGSIEEHSMSLPIDCDAFIAEKIALKLGALENVLVAPTIRPGLSLIPHMRFSGTISLDFLTFTNMVREVVKSLYIHGFRKFFIINGHGGNEGPLLSAIQQICFEQNDVKIYAQSWWKFDSIHTCEMRLFGESGDHADASETSLYLYLEDKSVRKQKLKREYNQLQGIQISNNISSQKTVHGVINADQHKASRNKGKDLFNNIIRAYLTKLNVLEKL